MPFVTTADGTEIFYKDWGPNDAQPIVFHHGWPVRADDWDNQLMFFLCQGFRVIAPDRRGHGRSPQTAPGNDRTACGGAVRARSPPPAPAAAVLAGYSPAGGGVPRYVARA